MSPPSPLRTDPPVGDSPASPAARRASAPGWRDPRLVIGVVIVAASMLAGGRLLDDANDTVSVWVARADLEAGSPVGEQDLARRDVGFSTSGDADRYVSGASGIPSGSRLVRAVGAGELLPRAALGAEDAETFVEVPISVPSEAVPASVQAGSVVDVWVTPDSPSGNLVGRSMRVFDDVRVLAAPAPDAAFAPGSTRQVIIAVAGFDDDRLAAALAWLAQGATVFTKRG